MIAIMPAPDYSSRLKTLRAELTKLGYDGYFIPMSDEYQSEYVPSSAQRVSFMSGFTGSAAFIIVMMDKALFFTDGRYTLQASQQIPGSLYSIYDGTVTSPTDWLSENAKAKMKLAYDPWLHTAAGVERLQKALAKVGAELVPFERNLVDVLWTERPAPPSEPIFAHEMVYAGKTSGEKRHVIAGELKRDGLSAAVITDCASIAWLLNVRGNDIPNTPLPLSFAVLHTDASVDWFVDPLKLTKGLQHHLGSQVTPREPSEFKSALDKLANAEQAIRVDPSETASWIIERLKNADAKLDLGDDPCSLPKACKNPVELEGMATAHRRDGAALVKFFTWLEHSILSGSVTEISAGEKLSEFRSANNLYRGPSFDTISGAGPNGAIVHYRASQSSNRKLEKGQFYLLDSGGQYLDGTTDVTRTVAIGSITQEMRERFTRVLKGHIALAMIRFPEGTTGAELDVLARQYLWAAGVDYNHGTGHGVGSYLGVHEGPQGISKRNRVALKPGMVVSNEPGYYKAGHYGIRIENLQYVTEAAEIGGGERKMLGFETLTLVPIDRRAIDTFMLSESERSWINTYHTRVREALRPMMDKTETNWLESATAAL